MISISCKLGYLKNPGLRVQNQQFSEEKGFEVLDKGVLFQQQLPLRVPNSTQRVSNYYQVRLKYWMQEMDICVKILELFCCFPLLFALIWTSPDCVLYNKTFVLRKTLLAFSPCHLGYQIPSHTTQGSFHQVSRQLCNFYYVSCHNSKLHHLGCISEVVGREWVALEYESDHPLTLAPFV